MNSVQNLNHFLTNSGYGGKCDPELSPAIAKEQLVPVGETVLVSQDGAIKIVTKGTKVDGYSDVESEAFDFGKQPDGKGGWILPPPPPAPDATTVPNWKLSAVLASKGVSFNSTDPTIAARWQYEPSFAIDGVVAKALQASLGYDDAQLQALFNEAAALK